MTSYTHAAKLPIKSGYSTSTSISSTYSKKMTFSIKDPGSALTHFIGMILAIVGTAPILMKAFYFGGKITISSLFVFMLSMILLYAASTAYHTFDINKEFNLKLKRLDHCMIPLLIAGSYTPVCLVVLHNIYGYAMFAVVWSVAIIAILFKLLWVTCPRWISSTLYIIMGWTCVMAFPEIFAALPHEAFALLLIGGIFYTIGGVIYGIKMPAFNARHKNFGTHEIFHCFVMAGSMCHYIMMFVYVAGQAL